MKIWVDADACPVAIREILFRAANRKEVLVTLVANQSIKTPPSKYIRMLRVLSGFDVADNEIVNKLEPGDLVITSDIPLADEAISKGAVALSSRGELFTKENIKQRLNMRDFLETMRSSGIQTSGPPPLSQNDKKQFADNLDKFLVNKGKVQ
ncbi:MAG: YaiI/YqxD family protein [Gammaproteobacteria bacterium]|nr:MAG: YaiI/YqxD family protein [Gammaproteobacteria bacterium]